MYHRWCGSRDRIDYVFSVCVVDGVDRETGLTDLRLSVCVVARDDGLFLSRVCPVLKVTFLGRYIIPVLLPYECLLGTKAEGRSLPD